jgi:hypothetical protein
MSESIYCLANDASKPLKFNSVHLLKYSDLCVKFLLDNPKSGTKKEPILLDLSQKDADLFHRLIHYHTDQDMFSKQDYEYLQTVHCDSNGIKYSIGERIFKYMGLSDVDLNFLLGTVQCCITSIYDCNPKLEDLNLFNNNILEAIKTNPNLTVSHKFIKHLYDKIKKEKILSFYLDFADAQRVEFDIIIDPHFMLFDIVPVLSRAKKQIKNDAIHVILYNRQYNKQRSRIVIGFGNSIIIFVEKSNELDSIGKQTSPIKPLCDFKISSRFSISLKKTLLEIFEFTETFETVLPYICDCSDVEHPEIITNIPTQPPLEKDEDEEYDEIQDVGFRGFHEGFDEYEGLEEFNDDEDDEDDDEYEKQNATENKVEETVIKQ